MKIVTDQDLDAPGRFAWFAYDDDTYDGDPCNPIGRGPTEIAAIRDLLDQIEDREDE